MMLNTARGPIAWFLRKTGYGAITAPWKAIYILPERVHDSSLVKHELVHIKQIERDGAVRWTVRYVWYLIRYGYHDSPYEIEARKESGG